mmetsp:Transcript_43286/g.119698  ORF Transcript_43286/g.119698 Transcript_43286/m.119698 type:complete len:128 (+) Transcript_43286:367-750(+)
MLRGVSATMDAKVHVSNEFQSLVLVAAGRERVIPMRDIVRVAVGDTTDHAQSDECAATVEMASGDGISLRFANGAVRNEAVLCLTLLADAARGTTLRLEPSATAREQVAEDASAPPEKTATADGPSV